MSEEKIREIESHIKHNEWYILNAAFNIARLKMDRYYIGNDGKRENVHNTQVDTQVEHFVYVVENRARLILSLKLGLVDERLSENSEFNTPP